MLRTVSLVMLVALPLAGDTGPYRFGGVFRDAVTKRPVPRVEVLLTRMGDDARPGLGVVTGPDGSFSFPNVPAGNYTYEWQHPQYYALANRPPVMPGYRFAAGDADTSDLEIELKPYGVITGRVLDQEGLPVQGATVIAEAADRDRGVLDPYSTAETNDLGVFRIPRLGPNRYYVSAVLRPPFAEHPEVAAAGDEPRAYPLLTYMPGVVSPAGSQRVQVTPGEEARADIMVPWMDAVTVSGAVRPVISGASISRLSVKLVAPAFQRELGAAVANRTAAVKPDGTFSIPLVTPGRYRLLARGEGPQQREWIGRAEITVSGAPAAAEVPIGPKVPLSVAPVPPQGGLLPDDLAFVLHPTREFETYVSLAPSKTGSRTEFQPSEPGEYFLTCESQSHPDAYISAVELNHRQAHPLAFRIEPSAAPATALATVELHGAALISKVEYGSRAQPAALNLVDWMVVGDTPVHTIRDITLDSDDTFEVRGLIPGTHWLLLIEDSAPCNIDDLSSCSGARRVLLHSGENEIEFKVPPA